MRRQLLLVVFFFLTASVPLRAEPLPDTKPLTRDGDLAAQLVEGIDKYLMREIAASVEKRKQYWKPDFSSPEAYAKSVQPNRERLKKILGVVDARVSPMTMELIGTTDQPALVAETERYKVFAVRWPVFPGVDGEGLLLEPKGKAVANVVAIPDADWTPEQLVGLAPGVPKESQFARRLADNGCRVVVPVLIDRKDTWSGNPRIRLTNQPHREFIYRQAYEMGRHVIGYEVQEVLAAVDWFAQEKHHRPIGVYGYGEGGLVAFCSAPFDKRIKVTVVSGYFGPREGLYGEPIYRNVWSRLREFGDAELALLVRPRALYFENVGAPKVIGPSAALPGRSGAAPGAIPEIEVIRVFRELARLKVYQPIAAESEERDEVYQGAVHYMLAKLASAKIGETPPSGPPADRRLNFDPVSRQKRQFDQLVEYTQKLMRESEDRRKETFWSRLNTSSLQNYEESTKPFRKQLDEEVIGKLPPPTEPMNPKSRQIFDEPKWKGYEVTLDLYPDVFAYGILCVPKDLKPGEKRPVVVCQHGLEGRPTDVVNPKERSKYYNSFGSRLADKGYVVFAPQNCYIGHDKFRVLQRKANPLGLSLFSFIIRSHERILDWLAAQPFVDGERIGFYGLSYGGKTAMRVPAVLTKYKCSICSGDFNEWTWKNVSVNFPASYMFSPEYEMPEFNMGHTLVYAEMAALIAPRPFMVERGHDDGVGIDEWVAYEYAKVRRLYSRLRIPERTEIEWFAGGHECHCEGTFRFLAKHLSWKE
jgi:dienelactone hydrolase